MPWGIAAAVVGGVISSKGAKGAAETQANAANQASAQQMQMFNQTQEHVSPWMEAGKGSLAQLTAGTQPGGQYMPQQYQPFTMDQFHQDPGYQFQLQQGQNALTNKASIGGGMNSNNLKGLVGFSQGLADQSYQSALGNYMQQFQMGNQSHQQGFNNLQALSGSGQNAALGLGTVGANAATQVNSNIIGAGNSTAAGNMGASNAINGALGQGYNSYLQQQFMNQNQPGMNAGNMYGPNITLDSLNGAGSERVGL